MTAFFISDLHLDDQWPALTHCFDRFITHYRPHMSSLYILGDLFESWPGDDIPSQTARHLAHQLATLKQQGIPSYIMPGNRDFLLKQAFAQQAGATLLDDPCIIPSQVGPILLMHGDSLCTDDTDYQRFRRIVRNPLLQYAFLKLPQGWRQSIFNQGRARSQQANQFKSQQIMDVNHQSVVTVLVQAQCRYLIHGHTHRPAQHTIAELEEPAQRLVLGDWSAQGCHYATLDAEGLQLRAFTLATK